MLSEFLRQLGLSTGVGMALIVLVDLPVAVSLPPPEDMPEEVLRTEIFTEARSPIDGEPLTAAEYAELQAQLQTRPYPPELSAKVEDTVFRLHLLHLFRTFLPFLPI